MAYTINKTNGATLTTVSDGTIDTTTDLTLIGKNYAGFGEFQNENFIKLLENFANSTAPSSPIAGQLWWDTSNTVLKFYNGTTFKATSAMTSASSTPSSNVTGDQWWDTTNGQLKVYDGSSFVTIGPAFTSGTGTSGAIVETVTDNTATDHVVVKLFVSDTVVGTISKDAEFTPQTAISGFTTIKPGYQASTSVSGAKFHGTATNSDALGGNAAASFLRSDASDSTSGVLSVLNDTGLVVGADSDFTVGVSGSDVSVSNTTLDGDVFFKVNDGGVTTTALTIDGATSRLIVAGNPTVANGVANKSYVDTQIDAEAVLRDGSSTITGNITPDSDNTRNLGSGALAFATIYATTFDGEATTAQYADLAEIYSAPSNYEAGTVVSISSSLNFEVQRSDVDGDKNVFGVVSDKPGYLLNSKADGVPVALVGRVPVMVSGTVVKGERLVSGGSGYARAMKEGDDYLSIIGRALESSNDDGTVRRVECVVGKN